MAKKKIAAKLTFQTETLRRLSTATLDNVAGGYASGHCDNKSFGFLCGDLCGGSNSCMPN
jgi:hypothetical protein